MISHMRARYKNRELLPISVWNFYCSEGYARNMISPTEAFLTHMAQIDSQYFIHPFGS